MWHLDEKHQASEVTSQWRRARERLGTNLRAKLVLPDRGEITECNITTLSGSGAAIEGEFTLASHSYVLIEVAGLGQVEGVIMWSREGRAGVRFVSGAHEVLRTNVTLAQWIAHAIGAGIALEDENVSNNYEKGSAAIQLDRFDGYELRLRTTKRYLPNSPFQLGRFKGTVVAHTQDGVVVHAC